MSLEWGMTDLVRDQDTERNLRKQGFVPCGRLDKEAKRHTSEICVH